MLRSTTYTDEWCPVPTSADYCRLFQKLEFCPPPGWVMVPTMAESGWPEKNGAISAGNVRSSMHECRFLFACSMLAAFRCRPVCSLVRTCGAPGHGWTRGQTRVASPSKCSPAKRGVAKTRHSNFEIHSAKRVVAKARGC